MRRLTILVATFALLLVLPLSAAAQETLVPGRNLFRAANGTASTPTRTYEADRCLGSFRKVSGEEGFTAGCVERWSFNASRILTTIPVYGPVGSATAPTYAFGSYTNKGWYSDGAGTLDASVGGVRQVAITADGLYLLQNSHEILMGASSDIRIARAAAGTLKVGSASTPVELGTYRQNTAYRVFTLTGDSSVATNIAGLIGGHATDKNVYLDAPTGGSIQFRPNGGTLAGTFDAATARFTTAADIYAGAGSDVAAYRYFRVPSASMLDLTVDGRARVTNNLATNAFDITLDDWGATLKPKTQAVANDATLYLGAAPSGVFLITGIGGNDEVGMVSAHGSGSTDTNIIFTVGAQFTKTKNNAGTFNVYYDAAGSSGAGYYLQNKRGSTRTIRVVLIGSLTP